MKFTMSRGFTLDIPVRAGAQGSERADESAMT
jgi:hypothetical protein